MSSSLVKVKVNLGTKRLLNLFRYIKNTAASLFYLLNCQSLPSYKLLMFGPFKVEFNSRYRKT